MRHLIVQDWASTHGNHAGMLHMCNLLSEKWPEEYKVHVQKMPLFSRYWSIKYKIYTYLNSLPSKRLLSIYERCINHIETCEFYSRLYKKVHDGDEIFLLEYMHPIAKQDIIAERLTSRYKNLRLYGLSHMTPMDYEKWSSEWLDIESWSNRVNIMLTLGSSLSNYLVNKGVPLNKVVTCFHYVDSEYYHNQNDNGTNTKLPTAIVMGDMQRDYELVASIVKSCPNIDWIICRGGKSTLDNLFEGLKNVTLKGFLSEDELRKYMGMADISVNVMNDTVGSNVITTSLSMGLAMVVSDVGSIRDYCDESNAFFCQNTLDSFKNAITKLSTNPALLQAMKYSALTRSKDLAIQNVHQLFNMFSEALLPGEILT